MAGTISSVGIGIYANTTGFVQPVSAAIDESIRWGQTVNGVLVPATERVNSVTTGTGLGDLAGLMELVELRTLATSQSIAKLAETTNRLAGMAMKSRKASSDSAAGYDEQKSSINELIRSQKKLLSPLRAPTNVRIVDADREFRSLDKLYTEIDRLEQARQVRRQTLSRGMESSDLKRGNLRTELADPSTTLSRRRDIESEINSVMSDRLRIAMELRNTQTGASEAELIRSRQQAINEILRSRQGVMQNQVEMQQQSLRAVIQQHQAMSNPPSLAEMKNSFERVTKEIQEQIRGEERLNQSLVYSADNHERVLRIVEEINVSEQRRNALGEKQKLIASGIMQAQTQGLAIDNQISMILSRKKASLSQEASARQRIKEEEERFITLLKEAIRLEQVTTKEARETLLVYREISEQQLVGMNRQINTATKNNGRLTFAMQNFGYAIEDATSQFGTRGLAGAIGAAGNNVSAMASTLNNIKVSLFASLGLAALQLAVQTGALNKLLSALGLTTEDLDNRVDSLSQSYKDLADTQKRSIDLQRELNEIYGETASAALTSRIENLQDTLAKVNADIAQASSEILLQQQKKELLATQEQIANLRDKLVATRIGRDLGGGGGLGLSKKDAAKDAAIQANINSLKEREVALQKVLGIEIDNRTEAEKALASSQEKRLSVQQQMAAAEKQRTSNLKRELEAQMELSDIRADQFFAGDTLESKMRDAQSALAEVSQELSGTMLGLGGSLSDRRDQYKKIAELEEQRLKAQKALVALQEKGEASQQKSISMMQTIAGQLNKDFKVQQEKTDAAAAFTEELRTSVALGAVSVNQARQYNEAFEVLQTKQDRQSELQERVTELKKQLNERGDATVQSSVEGGSAEAARIVAQSILSAKNAKENEPIVKELQDAKIELEAIKDAILSIPFLGFKEVG